MGEKVDLLAISELVRGNVVFVKFIVAQFEGHVKWFSYVFLR